LDNPKLDNHDPTPSLPERPLVDPFARITELLNGVMENFPDYYLNQDPATKTTRFTLMLEELNNLKQTLELGQIPYAPVNLFKGYHAKNPEYPEYNNHRIIDSLYTALNSFLGVSKGYEQIESDAHNLFMKNKIVDIDSQLRYLQPDAAILNSAHQLVGIQFQLTDNIIASFEIGNFGNPRTSELSSVDLIGVLETTLQ
jgi:hypothetical protein